MAMFIRAKRVSDPLDDRVKARLLSIDEGVDRRLLITAGGHASSGSEHGTDHYGSSLIHAFFDLDGDSPRNDANAEASNSYASDGDSDGRSRVAEARETLRGLLDDPDQLSLRLRGYAIEAAEENAGLRSNGCGHRRRVMARLREAGYNAGVCKAAWESSGGLAAGSYECVDVAVKKNDKDGGDGDEERYIVDLDFASQFAVARSTTEYEELVAVLPEVMVARAEAVRRIVRAMAEAAEASLKSRGLSVPPWRKRRYMLAKWFGPYRRTINPLPTSAAAVSVPARGDVQCRAVGFESLTQRVVPPVRGTR